jgi:hypothetical protein
MRPRGSRRHITPGLEVETVREYPAALSDASLSSSRTDLHLAARTNTNEELEVSGEVIRAQWSGQLYRLYAALHMY